MTTIEDPVSGFSQPKSIPQARHAYVIEAKNTGLSALDVNTVVIADTLPDEMRMVFGVVPAPIQFTDGSPTSGLSYTFINLGDLTDDIRFSNDGGGSFITPLVDATGLDATSPKINYFEVELQGVFNASSGAGEPSFQLRFETILE